MNRFALVYVGLLFCLGCDEAYGSSNDGGDARFVVAAANFGATGIESYAGVLPTLEAGASLDLSQTVASGGLSLLYAQQGTGRFFLDSIEQLTLTRYSVVDGRIEQDGRLSFAELGFSTTNRTAANAFASSTRAYLIDSSTLQMIVWNPEAMTIDDTVDLSELARAESPLVYGPAFRGRIAFYLFAYYERGEDRIRGEAVVLSLDLDTGSYEVTTDDQCGDAIFTHLDASGDLYFASGTANASMERLGRRGVGPSCLRRIRSGERTFDPDYHPTLRSLTDGAVAGAMARAADHRVYIRVLEESAAPQSPVTSNELMAAAAWSWWLLNLETGEAEPTDLPLTAGRFAVLTADERAFVTLSSADFAETILFETTVDPPAPSLVVDGIASGIARL